jgi:lysophospholipase L1-like esterase
MDSKKLTPLWLLAIGDSCTWGTDLTEPHCSLPEDLAKAWPAHLGKLLSISESNVINRGWPGRSNDSIFRIAIQDITRIANAIGPNGVVAIGWTAFTRWEIFNPYELNIDHGRHPGQEGPYLMVNIADVLEKGRLRDELPELVDYYTKFRIWEHAELEHVLDYIISTTALAKSLGIRIIHFNAVDEIRPNTIDGPARHLLDCIGPEFIKPFDRNWAMWPRYAVFPRSTEGGKIVASPLHPTEADHKDWANILFDHLNKIY